MDDKLFDLFDAYYNETLNEKKTAAFDKRIDEDETFCDEYRKYLIAVRTIKSTDRQADLAMQEKLAAIREQKDVIIQKSEDIVKEAKIRPLQKSSLYRRLSIAAGILLLIAAAFFIIPPSQTGTDDTLADNSFLNENSRNFAEQTYDNNEDESSGLLGALKNRFLFSLNNYFNIKPGSPISDVARQEYNKIIDDLSYFAKSVEQSSEKDIAYYFIGESHRQLKEYQAAIESYLKINDDSKIYDRKYLYLGKVYELNNEKDKAIAALKKVAALDRSEFKEEATRMLKEIEL